MENTSGISDLKELLANMEPILNEGKQVFANRFNRHTVSIIANDHQAVVEGIRILV